MRKEEIGLLKKKALALGAAGIMAMSMTGCKNKEADPDDKFYAIYKDNGNVYVIAGDDYYYASETLMRIDVDGTYYYLPTDKTVFIKGKNSEEEAYFFAEQIVEDDGMIIHYNEYKKELLK